MNTYTTTERHQITSVASWMPSKVPFREERKGANMVKITADGHGYIRKSEKP